MKERVEKRREGGVNGEGSEEGEVNGEGGEDGGVIF